MLAMNTLRHISQGYERLGRLQDQFASGKKITRASQDPVVAMNGMRYRTQVVEVKQFQRNLGEAYNWLENADSALDVTTQALHRIRELAVQASNDTYEPTQRANIAKEISQLLDHVVEMANTKSNGKYIFNGTDTINPPVDRSKMDLGINSIENYETKTTDLEITYAGEIYRVETIDDTNKNVVLKNKNGETLTIEGYNTDNPTITSKYNMRELPKLSEASSTTLVYNGTEYSFQTAADAEATFSDGTNTITVDYSTSPPTIKHNGTDIILPKDINAFGREQVKENQVVVSDRTAVSTNIEDVNIELLKGVIINTNIRPQNVFNNALFGDIISLQKILEDPTSKSEDITKVLDIFDKHIDRLVSERAELGARVNRAEMIENRQMEQEVIANRIMSNNEDADMEEVIIKLTTQETVHRAALAAGARIIQPTLMDFLR